MKLHEITSLSLTRCFESVHQMPDYSGFPLCLVKQAAVTCLTETDWTCYFENAESELSALASFAKNNYFGCTGNSLSCDFDLLHSDRDEPEFNKHESALITDSGWKVRSNSLASLVRHRQVASGMFLVRDAICFLHCMPPTLQQLGGGRFNEGD